MWPSHRRGGGGGRGWRKELAYVRSLNFITRNFAYAGEAISLLHSLPKEGALRDDTKNGCVADLGGQIALSVFSYCVCEEL